MTTFKKGDRVRRVFGAHMGMRIGDEDTVVGTCGYRNSNVALCKYGGEHDASKLELVVHDLYHLQPGDIVLDEDGDERKVIDVLPNSVLLSVYGKGDALDSADTWFTPGELIRKSSTLKQDTPAEVTELTLEDIAKLKGVDVSQIKIVEK